MSTGSVRSTYDLAFSHAETSKSLESSGKWREAGEELSKVSSRPALSDSIALIVSSDTRRWIYSVDWHQ